MEFWINKNFNGEKDTKIQIRMNMSVKVAKKENLNEAIVELDVEIGEYYYYISAKENTVEVRIKDNKITRVNSIPIEE